MMAGSIDDVIRLSASGGFSAGTGGKRTANVQYTDVVVIGNGPSGLSLSYLLSGHWPYYTGAPHTDSYLQLRLQDGGTDTSIIEQDLEYLSSGLEGRSSNPVALLFDALTHPDADLGVERASLLEWRDEPARAVRHVVLGRGRAAGGAWQMMEGQMQTLSLGTWMQLPNLPFWEWLEQRRNSGPPSLSTNRATMHDVRAYYEEYVTLQGLTPWMRNGHTVTSVERILDVCHSVDDESGEQNPCTASHEGKIKWEVRGYYTDDDTDTGETRYSDFCYRAPAIVLANGTYDKPNQLRVPGEHLDYILHSVADLERAIKDNVVGGDHDPLLIIGAGLSAADAILVAMGCKIPIIHVFRRDVDDPNVVLRKLPPKLYPEYHQVHKMMKDGFSEDEQYCSYQQHSVAEFKDDGKVLIRHVQGGADTVLSVSRVLVLIGSRPDLSFMPQDGKNLGVVRGMHVDSKHNPIDVDPFTYQCYRMPGLYAMGPLVGDTFVRFLRGAALAITSHLWNKKEGKL